MVTCGCNCYPMKSIISFVIRYIPRPILQTVSPLAMKVLSQLNQGKEVTCPVCSHSYKKFLPYGRIARENALCPNCLALERHRLMWLFLQEKTNFFTAPLKVLHVAPEHCFIKRFEALPNLDYITADIESPLAKVKMDVHEIPFPDNTFDVVFCNHVLEHVDDDLLACSEFNRVLKPGGWGILQSPVYSAREQHSKTRPSPILQSGSAYLDSGITCANSERIMLLAFAAQEYRSKKISL